jgi:Holliday junction resolvase RusA-like endonuclease
LRWTTYNVTPVPKPRQTQADKWKKRPAVLRYRAFADKARELGVTVQNGDEICFYLPMPASWSDKKRAKMTGEPHTQRPDLDNLAKSILDAVHEDDSHLWHLGSMSKRWTHSPEGFIRIGRHEETTSASSEPDHNTEASSAKP